MSASRLIFCSVAALAIASAASIACSSFSATEDPAAAGDGGGADTSTDGGAGAEGGGGEAGSCTAPLATDPQNCGKCGHSCLGGGCIGGQCQPFLVGTSNDEPVVDVAIDTSRVIWLTSTGYWSDVGHVYACPRDGCPVGSAPASLTGAPISTGSLASDGTKAFFSVPYTGGQQGVRAILPNGLVEKIGQTHVEAVRLQMRDGNLYFVTLYEGAPSGFTGHVYRWDGAKDTLVADFASPHNLADMVVIGDRVFFSAQEASFLGACPIGDPEPATCTPTDFTTAGGGYGSLTTDGTSVIWTNGADVLACRADQPNCTTPTPLAGQAQLGAAVKSIKVDHGRLYVITAANDLLECSLPDCNGTLRKLVHETGRFFESAEPIYGHSFAADDTAVYWSAVDGMAVSDGDGGTVRTGVTHRVMKLAK